MNLTKMLDDIKKYETDEPASEVAKCLKGIIKTHGMEAFNDCELLSEEIRRSKISKDKRSQLILVFNCSSISHYLLNSKVDLNLVDVNNVIHNVVKTTGLSHKTAIILVADIFSACGLHFAVEYGPVTVEDRVEYRLHALMPSDMIEAEIRQATDYCNRYRQLSANNDAGENSLEEDEETNDQDDRGDAPDIHEIADKAMESIQKLCAAGVPDGFYLLACCYLNGSCNTAMDSKKALHFMKIAAKQGHTEAAAFLGDMYYASENVLDRDYTMAQYYYTCPGALAIGSRRQSNLLDIYRQGNENRRTLVFSFILLAITAAFVAFFHDGMFSGTGTLTVGIISVVLSAVCMALVAVYHFKKRYNGIRWLIIVQFFIWAIYSLILVLS